MKLPVRRVNLRSEKLRGAFVWILPETLLLTANLNSNEVRFCLVAPKTGKLKPAGLSVSSLCPVCLRFVSKP